LLALNISPDAQNQQFGDQLLEFMLLQASLLSKVGSVVGITRCKEYGKHSQIPMEEYIHTRNQRGELVDTVLRLHEQHGAVVRKSMPNYRPEDAVNRGNGTVVEYILATRLDVVNASQLAKSAVIDSMKPPNQYLPHVEQFVVELLTTQLQLGPNTEIDLDRPIMEMGLDSADLLELSGSIQNRFAIGLTALFFFENNTCRKVITALNELVGAPVDMCVTCETNNSKSVGSGLTATSDGMQEIAMNHYGSDALRDIAVIGTGCRLPKGIESPEELWNFLLEGGDAISSLPKGRWQWPADICPEDQHHGIDKGGFLADIARFDSEFFRITPREAEIMDPQQRVLMELSWQCLENAGYAPAAIAGSQTGVFVGASGSDYRTIVNRAGIQIEGHSGLATSLSLLANRISYFYDFHGPSMQIDTACSSSLVALHEAIQSLRSGSCDQALVAGINIMCDPSITIGYYRAGMLARDGKCKPLDASANGYVRGEGAIMLFLKPLVHAQRDRDNIIAVLKGSAVNHGGQASGLTVPNARAQSELLVRAYRDAAVDMRSLGYCEIHGTGTALGDPLEMQGLKQAFAESGPAQNIEVACCGLGSIKSNLGHLEAAAGLAGVLKVILSMRQQRIPASLNFDTLNPKIDLSGTPFYVVKTAVAWPNSAQGRRFAGVSSFGSGGTNAHVVLEEYLASPEHRDIREKLLHHPALIVLSAKTDKQLMKLATQLLAHLNTRSYSDGDLADIAYTLQVGRDAMDERLGFTANSISDIVERLASYVNGQTQNQEMCYRGNGKKNREVLSALMLETEFSGMLDKWLRSGQHNKILELWVKGLSMDWGRLYSEGAPYCDVMSNRISLPTYPFEREAHWVLSNRDMPESPRFGDSHACLSERLGEVKGRGQEKYSVKSGPNNNLLTERVLLRIKILFSSVTKLQIGRVDAEEPLESYGIDSIMVVQLNEELSGPFPEMSKTVWYEYPSLRQLCDFLVAEYRSECKRWVGMDTTKVNPNDSNDSADSGNARSSVLSHASKPVDCAENRGEAGREIAIIGLSGHYAAANNIDEYFENLKIGKDCISEIPSERWQLPGFYEPDIEKAIAEGKSYSKWGGFLQQFSEFDPLFFNISPQEAASMDPQERLFLQASWEALEDAGYDKKCLTEAYERRVGVFVGITKAGFELYGQNAGKEEEKIFPRTSFSSVANRVSYCLDLHGPSMAIDTMCSASLTAIHEACEHLISGDCKLAIAGGVNLYLHPSTYVYLCAQRMLSSDGKCRSFGAEGKGFVPGEGVGTMLLKPLRKAIEDRDHIYGVIKGTSINHGGKTNGYSVPNPNAQRDLIRDALDKAGIDPHAVSYIEAHGTGTALGDPIEITGLVQAFSADAEQGQYCAIGSVKSNIGHLESAAGIAGVTKVLLQMKHKVLLPSLYSGTLNPFIRFANTPFRVQQGVEEWKRPVIEVSGKMKQYPRIAGISSFGAGGANAHVIVEEYLEQIEESSLSSEQDGSHPALIVLSAKNNERLREQAKQLLEHVAKQSYVDCEIGNIAHTLQVGRNAMEARLAFAATSIKELCEKLSWYLEDRGNLGEIKEYYCGEVNKNKEALASLAAGEDLEAAIECWVEKGKYRKLLELWVKGLAVDWRKVCGDSEGFRQGKRSRRISLPTYPFARERYWIDACALRVQQADLVHKSLRNDSEVLNNLLDAFMTDDLNLEDATQKTQELLLESIS
jgi:acyl transferase domain-containing protein/acyl carrier protein